MISQSASGVSEGERFDFQRDSFAFANELYWEYRLEDGSSAMEMTRRNPPPAYAHRCFVLVRSARQFLYHARFEPDLPRLEAAQYAPLIRSVVGRSPRRPSTARDRVVVPGYDCLRRFSQEQEAILKQECGGAWQSYFLRSHWRMVFPISRRHQNGTAESLANAILNGVAPIAHLVRFPQLTINHGILLFACDGSGGDLSFSGYDPNVPEHPVALRYFGATRTFEFGRNHYWPGGRVEVIHIYHDWLY